MPTNNFSLFLEAEDLLLSGAYRIESNLVSSGGQLISLFERGVSEGGDTGTASFIFGGVSGNYDIAITYFDENDGEGELQLAVGDTTVETWIMDDPTGSGGARATSKRTRTISNLALTNGVEVALTGIASDPAGEWARVDSIELIPVIDLPPSLAVSDVTVSESESRATFTVSLSEVSDTSITVDVATADDTAVAGKDYTATKGTLTFAPGETSQTVSVDITPDEDIETDETFTLNLSNATAAIADGQGTATISDDDAPFNLLIEAEDLTLAGAYRIENSSAASGGQVIGLFERGVSKGGETGTASFTFNGDNGNYDIVITYFDENDGEGKLQLALGDTTVETWRMDEQTGSGGVSSRSQRTRTISNLALTQGMEVTLTGTAS
ncbi:MAG: Calx-beta domain-containing protein, partial [Leptolyngbyaceae cyanobacterium]